MNAPSQDTVLDLDRLLDGVAADAEDPDARYRSPLVTRYAGDRMAALFSARTRGLTWRLLWHALAAAEHDLGLGGVSAEQVEALARAIPDLDLARVAALERELRHDVMAHVHHYGEVAPEAKGVIHLGATSCFVTDNGDLLILREGLRELARLLRRLLRATAALARREAATPCLGFTHYQPAQLTTVGKRAALWLQDLVTDHAELVRTARELPFRGAKGATGTQASFLRLASGDGAKVEALDRALATRFGFEACFAVTGQTYPRKLDHTILSALSGLAVSLSKLSHDLRLLQARRELLEPFGAKQIGSSAMPHKRNPMRAERLSALTRFVMTEAQGATWTAAVQWLERTLDDSAIRRLTLPGCFLGCEASVRVACSILGPIEVNHAVIRRGVEQELPFLATEDLLIAASARGGDRQELHERLRLHALRGRAAQDAGEPSGLREAIAADPAFASVAGELDDLLDASRFTGRAEAQTLAYLESVVDPLLAGYPGDGGEPIELAV